MIDKISLERIKLLHPKVRESAIAIVNQCHKELPNNVTLRITHTLRTFEEQATLYAQGRTTRGAIVTNAQPGKSYHNYALAFDIVLLRKDVFGKTIASYNTYLDSENKGKSDWMQVVEIAKFNKWEWGGDFQTFKDMPHFENKCGLTIKKALALYTEKKFIPGTKYINLS